MKRNFLLNPILEMDTISFNDSVAEKFKKVGNNTGNMVFVNAVKEQIEFEKEDWLRPDMDFSDQYTYVLPCSNFLHESNKWLEPLASLIENQPIKIILIGLGAQAKLNEVPRDVVAKLSAEQIKFFKIVAERCKNLGVRGEFTAECLNILGIKNSKVIGCPSIYKYLDGQFPRLDEPSFDNAVVTVRRHIVGGANRTLISVETPLRLCRIGTCRRLSAG